MDEVLKQQMVGQLAALQVDTKQQNELLVAILGLLAAQVVDVQNNTDNDTTQAIATKALIIASLAAKRSGVTFEKEKPSDEKTT